MIKKTDILNLIKKEVLNYYKKNLVTLCIFGSWARGVATLFSDIDILIICEKLNKSRIKRVKEFEKIEKKLEKKGLKYFLSPIIKTKKEVVKGSPLFFDMIDNKIILYDERDFFQNYLKDLKDRLKKLGAEKVRRGDIWFWVLKKDYKIGEVFSL